MLGSPYAEERPAPALQDCGFYHAMELPEIGLVGGEWDLRAGLDDYLGGVSVAGKRVLDVGTASGFLTFEMERRGAEVVGFDLAVDADWDTVPYGGAPDPSFAAHRRRVVDRLQNAWWLAHRLLSSRARACYGNVYDLPDALGRFDVAVVGSLLLHLRDPFAALRQVARLTDGTIVVTDVVPGFLDADRSGFVPPPDGPVPREVEPVLRFLPDLASREPKETWWWISPAAVSRFLEVLGFETPAVRYHAQRYRTGRVWLFTATARRR